MRILDEQDNVITQADVDTDLGHLVQDYLFIKYHEPVPAQGEVGHTRITVTFTDGTQAIFDNGGYPIEYFNEDKQFISTGKYAGKEVTTIEESYVIDSPYVPASGDYNEYEEILRYVLYTEEELAEIQARKDAIASQMAQEQAKQNEYNDLLTNVDDIMLALADSFGN